MYLDLSEIYLIYFPLSSQMKWQQTISGVGLY